MNSDLKNMFNDSAFIVGEGFFCWSKTCETVRMMVNTCSIIWIEEKLWLARHHSARVQSALEELVD